MFRGWISKSKLCVVGVPNFSKSTISLKVHTRDEDVGWYSVPCCLVKMEYRQKVSDRVLGSLLVFVSLLDNCQVDEDH